MIYIISLYVVPVYVSNTNPAEFIQPYDYAEENSYFSDQIVGFICQYTFIPYTISNILQNLYIHMIMQKKISTFQTK